MTTPPIVLVSGFWLGAWAWDEVVASLRADGLEATGITLPGLESVEVDRSSITHADHVDAICQAVTEAGRPVVLAVHSGTGTAGYAVTDRMPELIAAMVYVDSAPGIGASQPDFAETELALPPPDELAENESLEGLTEEHLATFRRRAVPEPGAVLREALELTNEARLDVASTMICTSFTSEQVKEAAAEGYPWLAGLHELRHVTWIDLPTSHWPMWSRPADLAAVLREVARAAGSD